MSTELVEASSHSIRETVGKAILPVLVERAQGVRGCMDATYHFFIAGCLDRLFQFHIFRKRS